MKKQPQAYRVITRDEVVRALDEGFIPAIQIFLDAEGNEIGTGTIVLSDPDTMVRQIEEPK